MSDDRMLLSVFVRGMRCFYCGAEIGLRRWVWGAIAGAVVAHEDCVPKETQT